MSCRSSIVAVLITGACISVCAHDIITTKITYSREISRLVYKKCASCHREGGSAFSLTTYEQARPWAKAIKEEVLERRMPPWGAVKGFGSFRDDQGLTQEELEIFSGWVEGGAPEGDRALLPKLSEMLPSPTVAPSVSKELIIDGRLTLKQTVSAVGIRAKTMIEGTSVQIVAEKPDGSIEPLIWLYKYQPQFDRPYYFFGALELPAGTKIECFPANTGPLGLLVGVPHGSSLVGATSIRPRAR